MESTQNHEHRLRRRTALGLLAGASVPLLASDGTGISPSGSSLNTGIRSESAVNVMDYGAKSDGISDDSHAFQTALEAADEIYIPSGNYAVSQSIVVPRGKHLFGAWSSAYVGNPESGSRIKAKGEFQGDAILSLEEHAMVSSLSIGGAGKSEASHDGIVFLHGRNVVRDVTVSNCLNGIHANYKGVNRIVNCHIHDNAAAGIVNPVDSFVTLCFINVNAGNGIDLLHGANDNSISNNKIEWNFGNGVSILQARHNVITANNVDRNGKSGIRMVKSDKCIIAANILRRNGSRSEASADDDTHIYVEDLESSQIYGNATNYGSDDDGRGYTSPRHAMRIRGGIDISVFGNELSGCTSTPTVSTIASGGRTAFFLNTGISTDNVHNGERSPLGSGKLIVAAGSSGSTHLAVAAMNKFASNRTYTLKIVAKDLNSSSRYAADVPLLIAGEANENTIIMGTIRNVVGDAFGKGESSIDIIAEVEGNGSDLVVRATNNRQHGSELHIALA